MTTADARRAGLDPAHILIICEHVAACSGHRPVGYATAVPEGIQVQAPSRRAAQDMHAALLGVGYQTRLMHAGPCWELLVSGWSADGLESRLAAMRAVIEQLSADPTATATAVLDRYCDLSARSPAARLGVQALAQIHLRLRTTVAARCGINAPRDPTVLPPDVGSALRLRAVWLLEQAVDDLIDRQLRIARRALPLFRSLRQHTADDRARDAAIRRAVGRSPYLSRPALQGTSGRVPPPLWPPRPAAPSAVTAAADSQCARSGQGAALDFPAPVKAAPGSDGTATKPPPWRTEPPGQSRARTPRA